MHPFKENTMSLASKIKRHLPRRKSDNLVLESCPLHTERPEWAAKAPAQVSAALARGADVIGFTELGPAHKPLRAQIAGLCAKAGYGFFEGKGDAAVAYKMTLDATVEEVPLGASGEFATAVHFTFHRSPVTVFALHWLTAHPANAKARAMQTPALVALMAEASKGKRLSFFLADSNPIKPVKDPASEPRASLAKAGLPIVWVELDTFPQGVGVTTIGRNAADTRVKAVKAVLSPALGSDHQPGTATYAVKRLV